MSSAANVRGVGAASSTTVGGGQSLGARLQSLLGGWATMGIRVMKARIVAELGQIAVDGTLRPTNGRLSKVVVGIVERPRMGEAM